MVRRERQEEIKELFDVFAETVYRYALHLLGNPTEAEDAVQEVFIRVACALPSFRERSSKKTWILIITRNYSLDVLRKRKRRHEQTLEANIQDHGNPMNDESIALRDCVSRLPGPCKEVVALHYFNDLSVNTISRITGVTESKARRLLREGLSHLKKMYVESPSGMKQSGGWKHGI